MIRLVLPLLLALLPRLATAGEVTVALASNVHDPMTQIADAFEQATGHEVRLVNGSTGKLYAQILRHAPFDVFLSADQARPALLAEAGQTLSAPITYATGQLVLWSRDTARRLDRDTLAQGDFRRLAIAQPELAPYGLAAQQTLEALELWEVLEQKLVQGESVGQAFTFAATGNAELGLVALSYVKSPANTGAKGGWIVPGALHDPIHQDMVVLRHAADNPAAHEFAQFLVGKTAKDILARFGYLVGND